MAGAPAGCRSPPPASAPTDVLKVIDQGADDTTNAVSIRAFFARTAGVRDDHAHGRGHDRPDPPPGARAPLRDGQILVYQVPIPEPLRMLEPRERETRRLHALADYGIMHVRLYEDIARMGRVTTSYNYPVLVNGRYVMAPSPIPKFDNPKLHRSPALQLFGAGREKRIYAVPPWTTVESLAFDGPPVRGPALGPPLRACAAPPTATSTRW